MSETVKGTELTGRVCVVTGGGSGIGRAVSVLFAANGAKVAVLDRDEKGSHDTVASIKAAGGDAVAIGCDVSDLASVVSAAERSASAFGPCEVLVNNAGVLRPAPLDTITLEEWNLVLGINLTGALLCSQAFGRQMRAAGKGALVHTASIAAHHATAFAGAYSVGKAGIAMLSRQLAVEWAQYGVRSNAVLPGLILTPMSQGMNNVPGAAERRAKAVPLGRLGLPEDIAQAVLYLASDRASYVSGTEITVDGAFTNMLMSMIPRGGYEKPADEGAAAG